MKIAALIITAFAASFMVSCETPPVYVPVYVPTETKVYVPRPKPVESAENFRAVEKPTTYAQ